jgi:hypothetical protein
VKHNHVRDERATRTRLRAEGDDKTASGDLPDSGFAVAWCGEFAGFSFLDESHALTHLRYSGSMEPCADCLRVMLVVIADEIFSDRTCRGESAKELLERAKALTVTPKP